MYIKSKCSKTLFFVVAEIKEEPMIYIFTCKISICLYTVCTVLYMCLHNLRGREVASASNTVLNNKLLIVKGFLPSEIIAKSANVYLQTPTFVWGAVPPICSGLTPGNSWDEYSNPFAALTA